MPVARRKKTFDFQEFSSEKPAPKAWLKLTKLIMLQAMFDADPEFGEEYKPFRKNKWVSITIAEKIVKK